MISFYVILLNLFSFGTPCLESQIDFCEVYGSIYVEEYPERADFLVFEESSEAFARLIIFEENNRLMADKKGKWYFTDNPDFADFTVYFTERRGSADFQIYFTEFESLAGCSL